jgi:hypothetical protein
LNTSKSEATVVAPCSSIPGILMGMLLGILSVLRASAAHAVGGARVGGNRGRNVGRGLSRDTSRSLACSPAGRHTRLLGCGSSGAGLWWTCEGLGCNVSKEAI